MRDPLSYHRDGKPGKLEIRATKPLETQEDLSLAYTPGVAEPVLHIAQDEEKAYEFTNKGNCVAIVCDGTAILGLGDQGALASKPVMEGKAVLFKKFADIDAIDIEMKSGDPDAIIDAVELMEPTFGGINLEDVSAPHCFYIEEELKKRMKIPVFHDDQHGTAIVTSAGLMNALKLQGKELQKVKIVINGAGAAGIAIAKFLRTLGVPKEHLILCDSQGVIHEGRDHHMNPYKEIFAVDTKGRTLEEVMVDADVFIGVSRSNCVTKEMIRSMAKKPVVFAMANPAPEISYDDATMERGDLIMATGRSDLPNQVNNILGFPFIFRGALDTRSTDINDAMKTAASYALADLAQKEVPQEVLDAYECEDLSFGPEYILPKPLDPRLMEVIAPAVAQAAKESGVAQKELNIDQYREDLALRRSQQQKAEIHSHAA